MLLEVKNLTIEFETIRGKIKPVDNISFSLNRSETLGFLGESGCGKSLTSLAIMGLLPPNASVSADKLEFCGMDILSMQKEELRKLRGNRMAMIFQDPMTSLNPSFTIQFQLDEVLKTHKILDKKGSVMNKKARKERITELLNLVGISDPELRLKSYPHELSGGMSQRVMIAMSIAAQPELLIADEPTTALDVTIQSQIISLLQKIQKEYKIGLIIITHDISLVSEVADRIQVMYAGHIVESGLRHQLLFNPSHPYTTGLLKSLPGFQNVVNKRLSNINGVVPDMLDRPTGCQFHPRCEYAKDICVAKNPPDVIKNDRLIKCYFPIS